MNFVKYGCLFFFLSGICYAMEFWPDEDFNEENLISEWLTIEREFNFETKKILKTKAVRVSKVVCNYCGQLFDNKLLCAIHINEDHPEQKKIYICDKCSKVYVNYDSFQQHVLRHGILFCCRIKNCKKAHKVYETVSGLRKHEKQHAENPLYFFCNFCDSKYLNNSP